MDPRPGYPTMPTLTPTCWFHLKPRQHLFNLWNQHVITGGTQWRREEHGGVAGESGDVGLRGDGTSRWVWAVEGRNEAEGSEAEWRGNG